MSKKNLLNLALLVFVVLLAIVIFLSEEEKNTELKKLTDIDINDIKTINIRHNSNNTSIVRNTENQWQITQPINIAANNFRINTILGLLNAPVHNQYMLTQIDTRETGLDDSQTSIQFNQQMIEFGIINPVTNLRYVKLDNRVYTIEDVYYPLITSHFSTLVSLNLLPANCDIKKIVLPQQTIYKDENGIWHSTIDSSADSIAETIQHWQHDQAFGVHQSMTRKELGNISVYLTGQEQPLSYSISDTQPWLIIARPEIGLEYHLDKEAYNNLISPAAHNQ